jgi:hypothetical protein
LSTTHDDIVNLKKEIDSIYNRKRAAVYALCKYYAGLSLQRFRQKQAQDAFFHNRTNTAYNTAFSDAEMTKEYCMFFLALAVEYGWPLELANNRKHESVRPTVMAFYSRFMRDLEALFAG